MYKVGIIGTGTIFDLNVLGYLENPDVQITCLCNRTVEKAKEKIKKFNLDSIIKTYSDYRQMLNKEDLDLVEILLPHNLHAEATIAAANQGVKLISVQKPMAMNLEEADKMILSCRESGSILSIYENFIFAPHIAKAKELIDSDYIGDPTYIKIKTIIARTGGWSVPESSEKWRKDPKQVGGTGEGSPVLFDNGWHAFSLAWWLMGEDVEKVFAWTDRFHGLDSPAQVMLKFAQTREHVVPQYGQLEFTYAPGMRIPSKYYPTDEFIEIIGTRGIMRINQGTSIGNEMSSSKVFAPIVIIRDGKVETVKNFNLDWRVSFINATHHLIDVIKNNKAPILSGAQARKVLQYNLAAIESSQKENEVFINQIISHIDT
jgi:predicted dehydrogenase